MSEFKSPPPPKPRNDPKVDQQQQQPSSQPDRQDRTEEEQSTLGIAELDSEIGKLRECFASYEADLKKLQVFF